MRTRKLITISLPSPLLKQAEQVADEENRTKSELVREALRFYVATRDVRRAASREGLFALIGQAQARTRGVPAGALRKVVGQAISAARSKRSRTRA